VSKHKSINDVEIRNFFNSCPRNLDHFPETPCQMGLDSLPMPTYRCVVCNERVQSREPNVKHCKKLAKCIGKLSRCEECPWAINSKKDNYCFWKWQADRSASDGNMEPLLQSEMSKLLECSSTKIHFMIKEAYQSLTKNRYINVLKEYDSEDVENTKDSQLNKIISAISDKE